MSETGVEVRHPRVLSQPPPVSLLGIGTALPSTVRRNDAWPDAVVDQWRQRSAAARPPPAPKTPRERIVLDAVLRDRADPFRGSVERRVYPADHWPSQSAIAAAQMALENSGVDRDAIDAVLVYASVPDFLNTNAACTVQEALGLPRSLFALETNAACNSFMMQLELASQMIGSGRARNVLAVQSSIVSPIAPMDSPISALCGDGVTAVVIGPAGPRRVLLSMTHRCDGSVTNTLVGGVPGKRWHEGPVQLYPHERELVWRMFLEMGDNAAESIGAALDAAAVAASDVGFLACHQGASWLRRIVQDAAGLTAADTVDTFATLGNLQAANLPLILHRGEQQGRLAEGMPVAMFSGGTGSVWSAAVLRW